ncbi:MAG: hypothetical protein V4598_15915 [Bdellovibrionota bacterium]
MKFLMIFALLASSAFANEVPTDCPAMNHSREKIVKDVSAKKRVTATRVTAQ